MYPEVQKAGILLREAVNTGDYVDKWDDKTGFKCVPPQLDFCADGRNQDSETKAVFKKLRKVNFDLSWKIPLQVVKGDANNWFKKMRSLDSLKSAMVVGDTKYGAQFSSKKV